MRKQNVDDRNERIQFAITQFEKHNIMYILKNSASGQFHAFRKCDDKLFVFYANGTITGYDKRGIHALIELLLEDVCVAA